MELSPLSIHLCIIVNVWSGHPTMHASVDQGVQPENSQVRVSQVILVRFMVSSSQMFT